MRTKLGLALERRHAQEPGIQRGERLLGACGPTSLIVELDVGDRRQLLSPQSLGAEPVLHEIAVGRNDAANLHPTSTINASMRAARSLARAVVCVSSRGGFVCGEPLMHSRGHPDNSSDGFASTGGPFRSAHSRAVGGGRCCGGDGLDVTCIGRVSGCQLEKGNQEAICSRDRVSRLRERACFGMFGKGFSVARLKRSKTATRRSCPPSLCP